MTETQPRSNPLSVEVTNDPTAFKAAAFDFLRRDPLRHTVILSNVEDRVHGLTSEGEPTWFVTVHDGSRLVGTAMRTEGRKVYLGSLPAAAIGLVVGALSRVVPQAPGVYGEIEQAEAFAASWCASSDATARPGGRARLFRLGEFCPATASGAARPAAAADLDLCLTWMRAFAEECGHAGAVSAQDVAARIDAGRYWLWERDGRSVSMAGRQAVLFGVARIGPVYTPPADRGHGYAGAVTSQVSRVILDEGALACLHTDLANPTSNKIYQAIGYEPVTDFIEYDFV